MVDKLKILEREYIIPLRKYWLRVPAYERTGKAIKTIKKFIAKHMKVPNRDVNNVKLDIYFNNDLWFRGRAHPPAKIKVKAIKEGDIVKVSFAQQPQHLTYLRAKHERQHKPLPKIQKAAPSPAEVKTKEKTEEQKTDEKEKGKSVEQQNIKEAERQVKEQKHLTPVKEPKIQRMALKK